MAFRLWFYTVKLSFVPLAACACLGVVLPAYPLLRAGVVGVVAVGLIGATLGLRMCLGPLRMRCPFCGSAGIVWGSRETGMGMTCPQCGVVRGGGRLGLRLARERDSDRVGSSGGR